MSSKKEISKQFSVSFPNDLTEEIDTICKVNYISRSSWLLKAAKELLEKERKAKIEKIKNSGSMNEL